MQEDNFFKEFKQNPEEMAKVMIAHGANINLMMGLIRLLRTAESVTDSRDFLASVLSTIANDLKDITDLEDIARGIEKVDETADLMVSQAQKIDEFANSFRQVAAALKDLTR